MTLAEINRLPLRRVRPAIVLRFVDASRARTPQHIFTFDRAAVVEAWREYQLGLR